MSPSCLIISITDSKVNHCLHVILSPQHRLGKARVPSNLCDRFGAVEHVNYFLQKPWALNQREIRVQAKSRSCQRVADKVSLALQVLPFCTAAVGKVIKPTRSKLWKGSVLQSGAPTQQSPVQSTALTMPDQAGDLQIDRRISGRSQAE